MIKKWLSRYSPHYPRALVYMLQASEYNVRDYLAWQKKVQDFARIDERKHFTKTAKGLLLLVAAWALLFIFYGAAILAMWFWKTPVKYVGAFFAVFCAPYFLAYTITIPLVIIKIFIQSPIEYFVAAQTKKRLIGHKAIKIAIAGSFGKTTMREILKTVLSEGKKVGAPLHNYNTPIGIAKFVRGLAGDEDVLIFEFGEYYPGDIKKLCGMVRPDIGVITGVNEAHLHKFKKLDKTVKAIYELADYLGERLTYVNGESGLARKNARSGHIVYDRGRVLDWRILDQKSDLTGTSFVMLKDGKKFELKSALLGLHQVGPLAAAVHIAFRLGLSSEQIRDGIGKTKPFEHRLEPKIGEAGVITLDDSYNGNPDGASAAIEFLESLRGRRRFYVTPGLVEMGARTEEVHKQIGKKLAKASIEKVILIKNSVTSYMEQGLEQAGFKGDVLQFDNMRAAFSALKYLTVKDDVVLIQNDWPDQYQ